MVYEYIYHTNTIRSINSVRGQIFNRAMDTLNEIISERGKILLCLNYYKFWKQTELKTGEEKWRCKNKKCSAVLKTTGVKNNRIITYKRVMNHEAPSENILQRQMLNTEAKREATDNHF